MGHAAIRMANGIIDGMLLVFLVALALLGAYSLWDANAVYEQADSANYAVYRPDSTPSTPSYADLLAINDETVGWLQVYGTKIDYPLVQAEDNEKYLTSDPLGSYSLSGSLFLDYRCDADFQDFATVVYGHHMDKDAMFGGLDAFLEDDYFEAHRHGDLFFDGAHHGIEFVASIAVSDAYASGLYSMPAKTPQAERYWSDIVRESTQFRQGIDVGPGDHLVVLSTCSSDSTNGRTIVVGRIVAETFEDEFQTEQYRGTGLEKTAHDFIALLGPFIWVPPALVLIAIAAAIAALMRRKRRRTAECARIGGRW